MMHKPDVAESNTQKTEKILPLLDQSPIGISISSHTLNRRLYTNRKFNELFSGDPEHSMLEVGIENTFVNPEDFKKFKHIVLSKKYDESYEFERRRIDGSTWWCLQSWCATPDWGDGAYIVWHIDISERKKAERELKNTTLDLTASKLELEILNKQKDRFFSIIAHDLKSPFDALLGFSSLISDGAHTLDRATIKEYSDILNDSAKDMYSLLENLLQWSRFQMKIATTNMVLTNLDSLIISNIKLYKVAAEAKHISIVNEIKDSVILKADESMLNTIIRNLIGNAIKFSNIEGEIVISSRKADGRFFFMISDVGIGMTDLQLKNLFSIDHKSSTLGTNGEVGTGLGLQLCYEMAVAQDAELHVQSIKGQGSTFSVSFSDANLIS